MTLEEQLAAPVDSLIPDSTSSTKAMTLEQQLQMSPDDIIASGGQASSNATILPTQTHITQDFNTYNPDLETFSGGVARDTNFASSQNTPVKVPSGQWKVVSSYNQASPQGYPGDSDNEGYGNAVMVQNTQTGEKLHLIHLAQTQVQPGQVIPGGTQVGFSRNAVSKSRHSLRLFYDDSPPVSRCPPPALRRASC